jgi:hypothetical protein
VILVASVYVAGAFGMAYVNSTPNDPAYSFGMGTMFLVALFAAASLVMMSVRVQRAVTSQSATPASDSQTT